MTTVLERARGWRRELHQRPGLAFDVGEAAQYIAEVLEPLGWAVHRGIAEHGLVASLSRGDSGRAIGLRSDMDGLAIDEASGVQHASRNPGAMHACGHDGHMAMLLGAAAVLASSDFDGTVHLFFQPAEEPGRGALAMIEQGVFDRFPVQSIYGLHNIPSLPAGSLHTRPGPIMSAEDNFVIRIIGRGGHASMPHLVVDPLVIGAELVTALQTVVSRSIPATESAVVSCTELHTDGARNAIAGEAVIRGDVRTFRAADSELIERRVRELAAGITAAHGAGCEVEYTREFRTTINDEGCTVIAARAAVTAVGADRVDADCERLMASEDFGEFARVVPGCFVLLGSAPADGSPGAPLHSRGYDFNDEVLQVGIDFYAALVADVLAPAR